jgi:alkylated DNA repair dioxygenase AlkB
MEHTAPAPKRFVLSSQAWIDQWPGLLEPETESYLDALGAEIEWREETYRMFGREAAAPRRVAWHGDKSAHYQYSGVKHTPLAWTPSLQRLRDIVQSVTGLRFNSVLANLYRDGKDSMGWHADDEEEVGPSIIDRHVASLSFGATRRFLIRSSDQKVKHEFPLASGDLLVMRGTTQSDFKHSVPKTAKAVGPRVNLTFREIITSPA